jgi:hypothetical protein
MDSDNDKLLTPSTPLKAECYPASWLIAASEGATYAGGLDLLHMNAPFPATMIRGSDVCTLAQ